MDKKDLESNHIYREQELCKTLYSSIQSLFEQEVNDKDWKTLLSEIEQTLMDRLLYNRRVYRILSTFNVDDSLMLTIDRISGDVSALLVELPKHFEGINDKLYGQIKEERKSILSKCKVEIVPSNPPRKRTPLKEMLEVNRKSNNYPRIR